MESRAQSDAVMESGCAILGEEERKWHWKQ